MKDEDKSKAQLIAELQELRREFTDFKKKIDPLAAASDDFPQNPLHFVQTLMETIPAPIFFKDAKGVYLGCNKAFETCLGITRENLIGKTVFEVARMHLAAKYHEMDAALLREPGVQVYEGSVRYSDGAEHEVIFNKSTWRDSDGALAGIVGVMVDISERKRAEERFRQMVELSPFPISIIDSEGRYQYLNRKFKEVFGYTIKDIPDGAAWFHKAFPDPMLRHKARSSWISDLAELGTNEERSREFPVRCRDGSVREILFRPAAMEDGMQFVTYADLTELKNAKENLRRSEERYRMIFDHSPLGIMHFDENGVIVDCNRRFIEIHGTAREVLIGFNMLQSLQDEAMRGAVLDALSGGVGCYEGDYLSVTGNKRTAIRASFSGISSEGDRVLGGVCITEDISERRKAEQALQITHRFLRIANEHTEMVPLLNDFMVKVKLFTGCEAVGIRLLDEDGRIPYTVYDGFSEKFYELQSPLSLHSDQCKCIDAIEGTADPTLPFYTEGGSFCMNASSRFPATVPESQKGETRNVCNRFGYESVALVPISSGERLLGLIDLADPRENKIPVDTVKMLEAASLQLGTAIQRVRTREALRKAHDELEKRVEERTMELAEANEQLKKEVEERSRARQALQKSSEELKVFAYSVMHDLKSPAIGAYGIARLLQRQYEEILDARGKNYCDQILKASEHIASLVEQINIYIATKEAPLQIEAIDLKKLVRMIKDEFSARLSVRRVEWVEPEWDIEIRGDRLCLLRTLRNFVDNALKYGGEKLSEIRIGYEQSETFHILSVRDDGVGIRKEDGEKIFQLFQRNASSIEIEGAGLGLGITRQVAERHGGEVWCESGRFRGATFCLSISKNL